LNRSSSLQGAIKSAREQRFPSDRFEILVVDNGSTDGTRELVNHLNADGGKKVQYIFEPRLGLHNARHAGALGSKGDILIFTDDDATFDPGWIKAYVLAFDQNPQMAAAGGPVRPIWDDPPPRWLKEYLSDKKFFPILSLMEPHEEFRLDQKGYFFGVNMAIRKNVLFDVGGFNPESFGAIWLGDGESGLTYKLRAKNMPIGYVPEALVHHHIHAGRMTLKYFKQRMTNQGAADVYTRFHNGIPSNPEMIGQLFKITRKWGRRWLQAILFNNRKDTASIDLQVQAVKFYAQVCYTVRLIFSPKLRRLVLKSDWLTQK
jgi:glucosyl-dolichyl phosphate glucuronosyltransferase